MDCDPISGGGFVIDNIMALAREWYVKTISSVRQRDITKADILRTYNNAPWDEKASNGR